MTCMLYLNCSILDSYLYCDLYCMDSTVCTQNVKIESLEFIQQYVYNLYSDMYKVLIFALAQLHKSKTKMKMSHFIHQWKCSVSRLGDCSVGGYCWFLLASIRVRSTDLRETPFFLAYWMSPRSRSLTSFTVILYQ